MKQLHIIWLWLCIAASAGVESATVHYTTNANSTATYCVHFICMAIWYMAIWGGSAAVCNYALMQLS